LRKESGFDVQEVNGGKGEFTVLVDGREVIGKSGDNLPSVEDVRAAVQKAGKPTAGATA